MKYFFTSESVTEGHPDKICDKIADKILDEALIQDPYSHMAVEATIKDDFILLYEEAKTNAILDYEEIARWVLKDIGYNDNFYIMTKISEQSSEIDIAVEGENLGAGDQGIMFGYACNETNEYMPLPIMLANKLAMQLSKVRKETKGTFILPDGKTQVTVEYENDIPVRINTIVIATQHKYGIENSELKNFVYTKVILPVIPKELIDEDTEIFINTGGNFTIGGPKADSGTTGRKIIVDTYGGMGRIGGGCFSSKDPTKVDRSGAYYARYVARNIISNKYADKVEIQVSYAIGKDKPISIFIETFGTEHITLEEIYEYVEKNFDFSVSNIINELDLRKPIYYDLAAYGHFGRNYCTWEKDKK